MQKHINVIALNAKSGAGKDYTLSILNFIRSEHLGNGSLERSIELITQNEKYDNAHNGVMLHEVSSGGNVEKQAWGLRDQLHSLRYSSPLRMMVQAAAATNFTMEEMDLQETKKFQPAHIPDQDLRALHLSISDAIKTATNNPNIFSDILNMHVVNIVSTPNKITDIYVRDVRYPGEHKGIKEIVDELQNRDFSVSLQYVHISCDDINVINHSSEQDLVSQFPDDYAIKFHNVKTRTIEETVTAVYNELYLPLAKQNEKFK